MKKRRNPESVRLANELAAYGDRLTRPPIATPNPSRGILRPAIEITDRAKRYRAQNAIEQEDERCIYCGAPAESAHMTVDHISGNEADLAPENLAYACVPCNTSKGIFFARVGIGRLTHQYNPRGKGITSLGQWIQAVGAITPRVRRKGRALSTEMDTATALQLIRETPHSRRSRFGRELWELRRKKGTDKTGVPF